MPDALVLVSVLRFIIVLSVLVVFHEWGHFIVARLCGIRVERFSIGMGPILFRRKMGQTEYCLSLLPIGGYVKLSGESSLEATGASWEFESKSLLQKFAVVFAGPFMNFVLAVLFFFSIIFWVGEPTLTSKIETILPNTPASQSGLLSGDKVIQANGQAIGKWDDLVKIIHQNNSHILLKVERAGTLHEIDVVPQVRISKSIFGKETKRSFIGISPSLEPTYHKTGFFKSIYAALKRVCMMTWMILSSFGLLITGAIPVKESLSGPIGIFFETNRAAQLGIVSLVSFMGALSTVLCVMNLLPIPALDGGHILFIIIEKIKGSALKDSIKEKMTQGGIIALLTLFVFVSFQDFNRYSIIDRVKNIFVRKM